MMTTEEKALKFVESVESLDSGKLAMLRRGCGERDPVEGRCPWLLNHVHGVATEATAFLVASLLAQYKTSDIKAAKHRSEGNFGVTWREVVSKSNSESIKRRFLILLDANYDPRTGDGDLPYRLRQMVRCASQKNVGIDWPTLLTDLKFWNHPEKFVQKRWARNFFSAEDLEEETTSTQERE